MVKLVKQCNDEPRSNNSHVHLYKTEFFDSYPIVIERSSLNLAFSPQHKQNSFEFDNLMRNLKMYCLCRAI